MDKNSTGETKIYNVLFPLWLLLWVPSPLWLILIPANYLIDRAVLKFSLPEDEMRERFLIAGTWKICLAGFASDIAGSLILLGILGLADLPSSVSYALQFNAFLDPAALVLTLAAIAVSGILIFLLDERILTKAGLPLTRARRSAMLLAIITAPYLFLIPSGLLYR